MKTIIAVVSAFVSITALAWGIRPGGGGGPGGGGQQPGGGGNQPGGGSGGSFTFDTFLTDSTTSGGCIVYGDLMTGFVAGQETITIPSTVTKVAEGVLAGNESVKTVDASAATGLAGIPTAFAAGCTNLTEITLPATVTAVGDSAFAMDAALTAFTGSGVTAVGDYAFFGCRSLVLDEGCAFVSSAGTAALEGVSYKTGDGDIYASEVAPLVTWIKDGGKVVDLLSSKPEGYDTASLKAWLASDADNLEKFLYASEVATNGTFKALSVSGSTFRFTAQDLSTLSVAHAALQVSTDLKTWSTVAESDIGSDGTYTMPTAANGFARIVYSLGW